MSKNCEKSFTFVEETNSDNGYDWVSGAIRFGELDTDSVNDLVNKVLNNLPANCCIRDITIIGHGAEGNISVGNGQTGTDRNKEISVFNEDVWGPILARLHCRFCPGGTVYVRGCNVGAGQDGADLVFRIARRLGCAIVQAPTGVCNPFVATGEDQASRPGDHQPPPVLPNPDHKKKKKVKKLKKILSGNNLKSLRSIEIQSIVAARYLPRVLGKGFDEEALKTKGIKLKEDLLSQLIKGLESSERKWLAAHAFSLDGYLQFQIKQGSELVWIPAGALAGGATFYSPLCGNTLVAYLLPKETKDLLYSFHKKARSEI